MLKCLFELGFPSFSLSELTLAFFLKSKGLFRLLISKVKRILIRFVLRMKIH